MYAEPVPNDELIEDVGDVSVVELREGRSMLSSADAPARSPSIPLSTTSQLPRASCSPLPPAASAAEVKYASR